MKSDRFLVMSHVWDNDRTGHGWSVYSSSLSGDASVKNKYRTGHDGAVKSSSLSSSVSVRNNSKTGHGFQIVITFWWCLIREQDVVEQWRDYSQDQGYEGSSLDQGRNLPLRMTLFFLLVDDHWDKLPFSVRSMFALQVARTPKGGSGIFMLLRKCAKNDRVYACDRYAYDDVGNLRVNFGNMIIIPMTTSGVLLFFPVMVWMFCRPVLLHALQTDGLVPAFYFFSFSLLFLLVFSFQERLILNNKQTNEQLLY